MTRRGLAGELVGFRTQQLYRIYARRDFVSSAAAATSQLCDRFGPAKTLGATHRRWFSAAVIHLIHIRRAAALCRMQTSQRSANRVATARDPMQHRERRLQTVLNR
jgi:hypothetical protein